MSTFRTIGECMDQSIARAQAEMKAGREVMGATLPMPGDLDPTDLMEQHLIEAIDALLVAAGSSGKQLKLRVLKEAAARHGMEFK